MVPPLFRSRNFSWPNIIQRLVLLTNEWAFPKLLTYQQLFSETIFQLFKLILCTNQNLSKSLPSLLFSSQNWLLNLSKVYLKKIRLSIASCAVVCQKIKLLYNVTRHLIKIRGFFSETSWTATNLSDSHFARRSRWRSKFFIAGISQRLLMDSPTNFICDRKKIA